MVLGAWWTSLAARSRVALPDRAGCSQQGNVLCDAGRNGYGAEDRRMHFGAGSHDGAR